MKNKGYTLLELLGVMIILALIVSLVFPSIINFIKSSNEDKDNLTRNLVYNAAEMFIEDNANKYYSNNGSRYCINIETLIENNYLKGDLEYQGKTLNNTKSVKVLYTDKFNYEIVDIDECTICKLVSDTDGSNSITSGDKYQCKVKNDMEEGYYFYVLSQEDDGTTNLIMDQNINSDGTPAGMIGITKNGENVYNLVAWNGESGQATNAYGPITAMTFLYNATKDWTNIVPVNYTYNDREYQGIASDNTDTGYISFVSVNGVATITPLTGIVTVIGSQETPLRARMPIYTRKNSIEYGEVAHKTNENAYLYDNLDSNGSTVPYIYWTLSSYDSDYNYAWGVRAVGNVSFYNISFQNYYGVRPVINVSNSLISK